MIIDISKWQGKINWDEQAPHLDFVIMRASCGMNKDEQLNEYATECNARHVPIHVYHFLTANNIKDAREQAAFFYATAKQFNPISYVLDIEGDSLNSGCALEMTRAFVDQLRVDGAKRVGLYTGNWAYSNMGFTPDMADWIWIARYGKNTGEIPGDEYKPVACDLWQYTSNGKAPGVKERVDVSTLYGGKTMDYFTGRDEPMAVMIGSARGDENGNAHGGAAGDQTGKEVSTQPWYKHSQGWLVFRAKDPEAAERIAYDMEAACDNSHIGYDQYERLTLYDVAKPVGFDCAKVTTDCETDCSALVRVCCAYAGIDLINFNTAGEPGVLRNSGAFNELTGAKYSDSSEYLRRGDILCTRTKGHTVVVLTNGPKAFDTSLPTLRRGDRDAKWGGDKGDSVETLQKLLIAHGFSVGSDGADGDFGRNTESAVIAFQKANGLTPDGVCGSATWTALQTPEKTYTVIIHGVNKTEMEELKKKWPQCEIAEEVSK